MDPQKPKYKVVVATKNKDSLNEVFSKECLIDMVQQLAEKKFSIFLDFLRKTPSIGWAGGYGEIDAHRTQVSTVVELRDNPPKIRGYIVPCGIVDHKDIEVLEDGTRLIHKFKLVSFGLTNDPADKTLGPALGTE